MKTIPLGATVPTVNDLLEQAISEPILLRNAAGRIFLLAEVDEADVEALALASNDQFQQIIERSRLRGQQEGWLTTEELRNELGL